MRDGVAWKYVDGEGCGGGGEGGRCNGDGGGEGMEVKGE